MTNPKDHPIWGLWHLERHLWMKGPSNVLLWTMDEGEAREWATRFDNTVPAPLPDAMTVTVPLAAKALKDYLIIQWLRHNQWKVLPVCMEEINPQE